MKTVETTRGVISFFAGSVPRARMASICSVTTIEPKFARHAGGVSPGHHQPGQYRPQLPNHAHRNQLAEQRKRAESLQRGGAIQSQNRPGEETGQHHDGQRSHSRSDPPAATCPRNTADSGTCWQWIVPQAGNNPAQSGRYLWRIPWERSVPCELGIVAAHSPHYSRGRRSFQLSAVSFQRRCLGKVVRPVM